jgi:hypothetical protein
MAGPDNASFPHEHQDQSQQANTDTTSPSIAHAEPQTFEATTAVLDTNELLHLIISAVPREYRTSLRRVSKNWQAAVLKIGHVMEPFDYDFFLTEDHLELSFGPIYALEKDFFVKHNPAFFLVHRCTNQMDDSEDMTHHMTVEHHLSFAALSERKHEFITMPPLSQALITADIHRGTQIASLRVRTGIRIGDLVDRRIYDWSDCESLGSVAVLGSGGEGDPHGEAEGGDGVEGVDGELEVG